MKQYLIFQQEEGKKMYLTCLPGDDYPLGGIGFQGSNDGSIPTEAGFCETEEAAIEVVKYLREEIGTPYNRFGYELREEPTQS
uniref:Uncharacterized protein n=1 Tax=Salmonella phage vB_SEnST11_KE22 TaxID=3161173 RepID=A0AAU8GFF6_9CAUD